jgi:predicted transposase/invertase (TIGR01784 family)
MEERPNRLSQIIDDGGKKLRVNNWANGLFSLKSVVAHIVKACIPEYMPFPVELIEEECFDSFIDTSGACNLEIAKTLMTKKPLPNGYMMDCDLLFEILPPKHLRGSRAPQLLNIEMQNDSRLLDRCIGRGMLYSSGIYYTEYEQIYKYPEFEKALKVNSVWICPAAPPERQGTVQRFRMMQEKMPNGGILPPSDFYDKLRLTFVNAGGVGGPGRRDICGFVWALTTPALSAETRKTLLKEAFRMEMTQVVEKQIDDFDWMLESYGRERFAAEKKQCREEGEQNGFKRGVKIGFARGEQSGFEKGEQSGFEKGEQSGFEKGIEQSKENFTLNMLRYNYRLEEISKMTGLSMERILQIARDNNLGNL